MTTFIENINTTIAKISECLARDPKRAERLLGDVKRWANELAQQADSQTRPAESAQQREKE